MSEFKGTPGPWFVTGRMTKYIEARIHGGLIQEVAACGPTDADSGYGDQQQANANLISSAPELLEVLQAALEWIDAVPQDIQLPTMPGFDRDWVDGVINRALGVSDEWVRNTKK